MNSLQSNCTLVPLCRCSSGTCVFKGGGLCLSHTAGYQQTFFTHLLAMVYKHGVIGELIPVLPYKERGSLPPFELVAVSGIRKGRTYKYFLGKGPKRLRGDQRPAHVHLHISLFLSPFLPSPISFFLS